MRTMRLIGLTLFLFGSISTSGWAFDDARHHFGSDYDGGRYGFGHGRFLLSPYYAYHPREVKKPKQPPVYVERQNIELSAAEEQFRYWHYCNNPKGYYPNVRKCSEDWLPVAPQP